MGVEAVVSEECFGVRKFANDCNLGVLSFMKEIWNWHLKLRRIVMTRGKKRVALGLVLASFLSCGAHAFVGKGEDYRHEQIRSVAAKVIAGDLGHFLKQARAQDWSDEQIARALQVTFDALSKGEQKELVQLQSDMLKDEKLYHNIMTLMALAGSVATAIVGGYLAYFAISHDFE